MFVTVAAVTCRQITQWDKTSRSITSVLTRQPRGWTSRGLDRRRGKTPEMNWPKSDIEIISKTTTTVIEQ